MSPDMSDERLQRVGVPRASGDEPGVIFPAIKGTMCSPRERG